MTRGLFEIDDRAPFVEPVPVAPIVSRRQHPGITDAEAKLLGRAVDVFKIWLLQRSAAELDAADIDTLARRHAPMTAPDIAQMIQVRRKSAK